MHPKDHNTFQSFGFALKGILNTIRSETNMKIHLAAAIVVCALGFYQGLTGFEWIAILISIGCVLAAELMNTSIEKLVDLASPEYHVLAGQAKDAAAGAVLVLALMAVIIGGIVFLPKFL